MSKQIFRTLFNLNLNHRAWEPQPGDERERESHTRLESFSLVFCPISNSPCPLHKRHKEQAEIRRKTFFHREGWSLARYPSDHSNLRCLLNCETDVNESGVNWIHDWTSETRSSLSFYRWVKRGPGGKAGCLCKSRTHDHVASSHPSWLAPPPQSQ